MPLLNEPFGGTNEPTTEWSEADGLRHAFRRGAIAAGVLAIPTGLLAGIAPYFAIGCFARGVAAFLVAWVLFSVVQRAAGFAGVRPTALAAGLALLSMLSNHLVFAILGVNALDHFPDGDYEAVLAFPAQYVLRGGALAAKPIPLHGVYWFTPYVLFMTNLAAAAGIAVAAAFRHTGRFDTESLAGILGER